MICFLLVEVLSVCLSVALWYCIQTEAHIIEILPSSGGVIILVFESHCRYKISMETPLTEGVNARIWENRRSSGKWSRKAHG